MAIPGYMQQALRNLYVAWADLYVLDEGDDNLIVAMGELRRAIERSEGDAQHIFGTGDAIWATLSDDKDRVRP